MGRYFDLACLFSAGFLVGLVYHAKNCVNGPHVGEVTEDAD